MSIGINLPCGSPFGLRFEYSDGSVETWPEAVVRLEMARHSPNENEVCIAPHLNRRSGTCSIHLTGVAGRVTARISRRLSAVTRSRRRWATVTSPVIEGLTTFERPEATGPEVITITDIVFHEPFDERSTGIVYVGCGHAARFFGAIGPVAIAWPQRDVLQVYQVGQGSQTEGSRTVSFGILTIDGDESAIAQNVDAVD